MEERRESEERRRRDAIVEPLFGGLEDADGQPEQEKSTPESVSGSRGASSSSRRWWLFALAASFLVWWFLR